MPIPLHSYIRIPLLNATSPFALQITINLFTLIPMLTRAAVCLAFSPADFYSSSPSPSSIFCVPSPQVEQSCRSNNWGERKEMRLKLVQMCPHPWLSWSSQVSTPQATAWKGDWKDVCVPAKGQYTKHSRRSCRNQIMLPKARASLQQYN